MTPADEQAIEYAELSVRLSAILQKADQDVQGALLAWRQALRCIEDWRIVAENQRREIAALEQEIASLVNDLGFAMAAMRAYRECAGDMGAGLNGAELLLAALRELERRRDATTPVGREADTIVALRRDLADAHAANRAYAGGLTAIRLALGAEEDGNLVEEVTWMVSKHAALCRQNGELTHVLARMTTQAACTQQRFDRLMDAVGAYQEAIVRIDGIQAAEEHMRAVYAEAKGAQGDD